MVFDTQDLLGFWTLSFIRYYEKLENKRFRKWIYFRCHVVAASLTTEGKKGDVQ
jgi:hypothetical protein